MDARIATLKAKFSSTDLAESIWLFTRQVTTLEQLSEEQLDRYYNKFFPRPKPVGQIAVEALSLLTIKEKRAIILAIATRCGIKEPEAWDKFNAFMLKSSVHKKHLNAYNLEELNDLIRQFKQLEINFNQSAESNILNKAHQQKYNQHGFSEN